MENETKKVSKAQQKAVAKYMKKNYGEIKIRVSIYWYNEGNELPK